MLSFLVLERNACEWTAFIILPSLLQLTFSQVKHLPHTFEISGYKPAEHTSQPVGPVEYLQVDARSAAPARLPLTVCTCSLRL